MLQSWLWLTFVLSVELCLNLSDDLIVKFLSPRKGETLEMTLKCLLPCLIPVVEHQLSQLLTSERKVVMEPSHDTSKASCVYCGQIDT